jgi:bacterioferritin-associated ferredoxin
LTTILIYGKWATGLLIDGFHMYVCVCQAVTERQIREAARQGLRTVKALKECMGLAGECAKCARCAHQILRECIGCAEAESESGNGAL